MSVIRWGCLGNRRIRPPSRPAGCSRACPSTALPLARRLPKRGFNNKRFGTVYIPGNLDSLNQFEDGDRVDEAKLREVGLVNGRGDGVKILARGKLEKKLTVCVAGFSARARAAIEGKGGTCEAVTKVSAVASKK